MIWYLFVIISLIFLNLAVIIDNFLARNIFRNIHTFIFYSSIISVCLIPLLLLFGNIGVPPIKYVVLLIITGFTEIVYLYPYLKSLKNTDASVTVALFSLGKFLLPLLAFIFLNEHLKWYQYAGFFLIISSSLMLTNTKKFKIGKSFWYMLLASFIISIESLIYKAALDNMAWNNAMFWSWIFAFCWTMILGFIFRKKIYKLKKSMMPVIKYFVLEELLNFAGIAALIYALSKASVTQVQGLSSITALIGLGLAVIGHKIAPRFFKEDIRIKSVIRKVLFFVVIGAGIVLTVI